MGNGRQRLQGLGVGVEAVHENLPNAAAGSLPHNDFQKRHVVLERQKGFGAPKAHAGPQSAI